MAASSMALACASVGGSPSVTVSPVPKPGTEYDEDDPCAVFSA